MENATLILLVFLAIISYVLGLRNTVFQFSFAGGKYSGFGYIKEIYFSILMGVFFVRYRGVEKLNFVMTDEGSTFYTSITIVNTVIIFIIALSIFSKKLFRSELRVINNGRKYTDAKELKSITISIDVCIALLLILNSALLISGQRHVFLYSIFSGYDLLELRLYESNANNVIPQVVTYTRYTVVLASIFFGLGMRLKLVGLRKGVVLCALIIFSATYFGDKSPLISCLLVSFFSWRHGTAMKISDLFRYGALIIVMLALIYTQFDLQNINQDFDEYLLQRLGAGQIQGVYEQFALEISSSNYLINEVPISGRFFDAPSYSKDLMMNTFGYYLNESDVGVMNSYFIGEAYAVGGYLFVYTSPILAAFNISIGAYLLTYFFRRYSNLPLDTAQLISGIFVTSIMLLTVDLGGLIFAKKILGFAPLFIIYNLLFVIIRRCEK